MVPIAVGAGVINDLVKYAAYRKGLPFMSVATAASMDGYASGGAPLSKNGFKHTIACVPPRVIVADSHILATAPAPMAGWGYGDLAGKIPAGADWIIADALRVEAMDHDVCGRLCMIILATGFPIPRGLPKATARHLASCS